MWCKLGASLERGWTLTKNLPLDLVSVNIARKLFVFKYHFYLVLICRRLFRAEKSSLKNFSWQGSIALVKGENSFVNLAKEYFVIGMKPALGFYRKDTEHLYWRIIFGK